MPSELLISDAPHELTLANGLRVVYEPMPWLPTISANLLLPLGSATDPEGREGSTNVLHEWLQRGAGELDSRAYSDALEDLGARRGVQFLRHPHAEGRSRIWWWVQRQGTSLLQEFFCWW